MGMTPESQYCFTGLVKNLKTVKDIRVLRYRKDLRRLNAHMLDCRASQLEA